MANSTQGLAVLVFLGGFVVLGAALLKGSVLLGIVGVAAIAGSVPLLRKAKALSTAE